MSGYKKFMLNLNMKDTIITYSLMFTSGFFTAMSVNNNKMTDLFDKHYETDKEI